MLAVVVIALVGLCAQSCASSDPEQLHLARTRSPSELVAMWVVQTPLASAPAGICTFQAPGAAAITSTATTHTYAIDGFGGSIYRSLVSGLQPSTMYRYRCGSTGALTSEYTVRTAPTSPSMVEVLLWGDMGASAKGHPIGEDSTFTQRALANEARTGRYSLALNVGDTSYANRYGANNSVVEDRYYNEMQECLARTPMNLVVGNHDAQYDFAAINNRTAMPVVASGPLRRFYYSFDHGPMHIVVYSTELPTDRGGEQWTFVKSDLEAVDRSKTPWVVAMTHHAFYCSDRILKYPRCTSEAEKFRAELEDVFHDNKVDIHFAGHNHMAEASYPTYKGQPTQKDFVNANATVYVVQGAAGDIEGNEPLWYDVPWREWHGQGFATQYSRLAVNATHFNVDFVRSKTEVLLHSITLIKQ